MKKIFAIMLAVLCTACVVSSRRVTSDKDANGLQSGFYRCYTNETDTTENPPRSFIARECSYTGGPYRGAWIYPATREDLNALSLFSYSSAASGDYMLIPTAVICYPLLVVNLPVQFTFDTLLIPWDLYNKPIVPEGYHLWK